MSSDRQSEPVVRLRRLGKCYHIYDRPQDRLRQFLSRGRRQFYKEFWALRDVDLDVYPGETLGIVGQNGAGKSTLLQMIAGTLQPTTGEVDVNGRVTALLELGSGFNVEFSGRENVYLSGAILGIERAEMDVRIADIAEFANIGPFFERPVKTYSRGMFARLAFAVYANLDPDIFIVDEALAVGDAKFRHRCMHRFRQMQDSGVSILFVSHDAASMKHLCDRVVWIEGGRLRMAGNTSKVVEAYLTHLFHGDVTAEESPSAPPNDTPEQLAIPTGESALRDVDERIGSGACRFEHAGIYDANGQPVRYLDLPGEITLRVTIRNLELDPNADRIQTGWLLRNARSLVVTSTNSGVEGVDIPVPPRGECVTIRHRIRLPRFAAGSYAITLTASKITDTQPEICDRVVNALLLKTTASRAVFGVVGAECEIEVEQPHTALERTEADE